MKKILMILTVIMILSLTLALVLIASGDKEEAETMVLKFVHNPSTTEMLFGDREMTLVDYVKETFEAENLNTEVRLIAADIAGGSTITMDVLNAAGEPADVYTDYIARVGKYMNPAWALPLDDYIDLSVYYENMLEPLKREGKVYAVPMSTAILGIVVNLDMLAELGIDPPDADWTIDDFLTIAVQIKETSDYYATGLFTGNQSCDYLYMNWFASFGTVMYNEDYTKSTVNTPAGIQTLQFLQYINDSGFTNDGAEVFVDDDMLALWVAGEIAFSGGFNGWPRAFGCEFDYKVIPFPKTPGVDSVPGCGNYNGVVVHRSEDEARNKMAAKLAALVTGKEAQQAMAQHANSFPTIKGVTIIPTLEGYEGWQHIFENAGVWDQGIALPVFAEIRKQMFPILAKLYVGKITPEDAAALFDKNVDAILNQ